jgi:ABC-2 type transport system ATP-binding protein
MADTQRWAVAARGLRRVYTARKRGAAERVTVALDGAELRISHGEIHGLLGPNGAGKTTLCKILATVLLPTAGSASVLGHDVVTEVKAVRPLVGLVLGGERGLYTRLTARQNLRYWAALYRLRDRQARARTEELLERFGLGELGDERVERFSRGMKQRLHLARGLIGDPQVLLFDEPTTGMDPVAAHEFRGLVGELRGEGRTLLLTTHNMAEAESVCDRVTMIDRGRILATETPRELARWMTATEHVTADEVSDALAAEIAAVEGISDVECLATGGIRVRSGTREATATVVAALARGGANSIRTSVPSLEEVYLRMIGRRGMQV